MKKHDFWKLCKTEVSVFVNKFGISYTVNKVRHANKAQLNE